MRHCNYRGYVNNESRSTLLLPPHSFEQLLKFYDLDGVDANSVYFVELCTW